MPNNKICRYAVWCVAFLAPMAPLMGQTDTTLEAHVLPSLFDDSRDTRALDINDRGQIVGWSTNSADQTRATLWNQQGDPQQLACPQSSLECNAIAINKTGSAVGTVVTAGDPASDNHFIVVWNPAGEANTPAIPQDFSDAVASDINDSGWVLGTSWLEGYYTYGRRDDKPTLWRKSTPSRNFRVLKTQVPVAQTSEARALNQVRKSSRLVVGATHFLDSGGVTRATAWDRHGRSEALRPLTGDVSSIANSVNRGGTVAGNSIYVEIEDQYVYRVSTAVVWGSNGRPVPLELLPGCSRSSAEDINDAGFVVGQNFDCAGRSGGVVAVIWNPEGNVFALPLPAKFIEGNALAINSQGDIVGYAARRNGKTVAIVWK